MHMGKLITCYKFGWLGGRSKCSLEVQGILDKNNMVRYIQMSVIKSLDKP